MGETGLPWQQKPQRQNNKPKEKFFEYDVVQTPPRRPVRWLSACQAGNADDRSLEASSQQAHHQPRQNDDWLLGGAQATPQPGLTRPRLSWSSHYNSQSPAAQLNQPPSQQPPQRFQSNATLQQQQQKQQQQQQQQRNHQQQWQQPHRLAQPGSQQAAPRTPQQPAANSAPTAAQQEQYLRNMQQIKRQEAEHEMRRVHKQQRHQSPGEAGDQGYQSLGAGGQRKRRGGRQAQPAAEVAPSQVVLPPDVTLRQLAQLLGDRLLLSSITNSDDAYVQPILTFAFPHCSGVLPESVPAM